MGWRLEENSKATLGDIIWSRAPCFCVCGFKTNNKQVTSAGSWTLRSGTKRRVSGGSLGASEATRPPPSSRGRQPDQTQAEGDSRRRLDNGGKWRKERTQGGPIPTSKRTLSTYCLLFSERAIRSFRPARILSSRIFDQNIFIISVAMWIRQRNTKTKREEKGVEKNGGGNKLIVSAVEAIKPVNKPSAQGADVAQVQGMSIHEIPTRYIRAAKGNMTKARKRWEKTWQWRKDWRMDEALHEGWPGMEQLKHEYRHIFHGRAKNGHVVYYDRLDFKYMSAVCDKKGGPDMSPRELIRYYMFHTDFVYDTLIKEDPGGKLITVYDLSRLSLSSLLGSATGPIRSILRFYSQHYPERQDKIFVINAPFFFPRVWASLRPFLDPAVVNSISISSQSRTELLDHIGAENVPLEYGGTDKTPLGESKEEKALIARVVSNRKVLMGSVKVSPVGEAALDQRNGVPSCDPFELPTSRTRHGLRRILRAKRLSSAAIVALISVWLYAYLLSG